MKLEYVSDDDKELQLMSDDDGSSPGSASSVYKPGGPGPSTSKTRARVTTTLGKGRACLKCRARKMRCDGKHPACGACSRAKRECVYEEERSRTKKLLDKIEVLEATLSKLQTEAAASGHGLPGAGTPDAPLNTAPWLIMVENEALTLGSMALQDIDFSGEWWWASQPPPPIQKYLLEVFLSQRARPGLHFHVGRFRDALFNASSAYPRPSEGLLNSMYLLGCQWSGNALLNSLEAVYLERARKHLAEELASPDVSVPYWIMASCLVSFYLMRVGRFLEARHELSGAANLVVAYGLHKIKSSVWVPAPQTESGMRPPSQGQSSSGVHTLVGPGTVTTPSLPPPRDSVELGERIGLFWMTYVLDHIMAIICGLSPNRHFEAEAETVWPRPFEEYESGNFDATTDASISSLFGPSPTKPFDPPCCLYALRMKAVTLLAKMTAFETSCVVDRTAEPTFMLEFQRLHHCMTVFNDGLPPLTYDPTKSEFIILPTPQVNLTLYLCHTMSLVGFVHLYGSLKLDDQNPTRLAEFYQRRLAVCRRMVVLTREMEDAGVELGVLPTTCGFAWCAFARIYVMHLRRLRVAAAIAGVGTAIQELEDCERDLDTLLSAIYKMSLQLPILGYQLDRLHELIREGDSEVTAVGLLAAGTAL